MPNWKKLLTSGSSATLFNLVVDNHISASLFSGSFYGDGSGLTNVSAETARGYSNEISMSTDYSTPAGTYNSFYGPMQVNQGITFTITDTSVAKIEIF